MYHTFKPYIYESYIIIYKVYNMWSVHICTHIHMSTCVPGVHICMYVCHVWCVYYVLRITCIHVNYSGVNVHFYIFFFKGPILLLSRAQNNTYIHTCTCTVHEASHMYMWVYVYTYTYMYIHTHIHTVVHTYICVYTCIMDTCTVCMYVRFVHTHT